ncbi:CLUMA_CG019941, isoform A [Clunio marinus]|uniref:CLUMA_CG019941, isoform A n=1 Tax=Clunio marinus TaxID=568069 RepID=A0A1J1J3S0_9DIPT|nr:CLUMA_CG019941, isoform A [Clunio marinus]
MWSIDSARFPEDFRSTTFHPRCLIKSKQLACSPGNMSWLENEWNENLHVTFSIRQMLQREILKVNVKTIAESFVIEAKIDPELSEN